MKALVIISTLIIILISHISFGQNQLIKEKITPEELSTWPTLDKGKTTINKDELIIEEIKESDGYFLFSPKSYSGNVILNYKVKALSESAVLIVLLSASDTGDTEKIIIPTGIKKEDIWQWRKQLEHYNFTFNNRSHGYKPFFYKNIDPLTLGFRQSLSNNIIDVNRWYTVEIGKYNSRIWFKLDNKVIFDIEDCRPFSGGHIVFRISGTTGEKVIFAKAAIKDVVISHQ